MKRIRKTYQRAALWVYLHWHWQAGPNGYTPRPPLDLAESMATVFAIVALVAMFLAGTLALVLSESDIPAYAAIPFAVVSCVTFLAALYFARLAARIRDSEKGKRNG